MSIGKSPGSYDPHGYQPLVVDEDCLTQSDGQEAILYAWNHPENWRSYLSSQERDALAQAQAAFDRRPRLYFCQGEPPQRASMRSDYSQLGLFRAFSQKKYGDGGKIWFGDGRPPWQR